MHNDRLFKAVIWVPSEWPTCSVGGLCADLVFRGLAPCAEGRLCACGSMHRPTRADSGAGKGAKMTGWYLITQGYPQNSPHVPWANYVQTIMKLSQLVLEAKFWSLVNYLIWILDLIPQVSVRCGVFLFLLLRGPTPPAPMPWPLRQRALLAAPRS